MVVMYPCGTRGRAQAAGNILIGETFLDSKEEDLPLEPGKLGNAHPDSGGLIVGGDLAFGIGVIHGIGFDDGHDTASAFLAVEVLPEVSPDPEEPTAKGGVTPPGIQRSKGTKEGLL